MFRGFYRLCTDVPGVYGGGGGVGSWSGCVLCFSLFGGFGVWVEDREFFGDCAVFFSL